MEGEAAAYRGSCEKRFLDGKEKGDKGLFDWRAGDKPEILEKKKKRGFPVRKTFFIYE